MISGLKVFHGLLPEVEGQWQTLPPSEKLKIACVGVGGQGGGVLNDLKSENIVALSTNRTAQCADHRNPSFLNQLGHHSAS